jgi:hypothetical protein
MQRRVVNLFANRKRNFCPANRQETTTAKICHRNAAPTIRNPVGLGRPDLPVSRVAAAANPQRTNHQSINPSIHHPLKKTTPVQFNLLYFCKLACYTFASWL